MFNARKENVNEFTELLKNQNKIKTPSSPTIMISPIKVHQALVLFALLDRFNMADKDRVSADFLDLIDFAIKAYK